MKVTEILDTIDKSKMVTDYVDIFDMCQEVFQIYDFLQQPEGSVRLTYCYYHEWICTDTQVGIRVWYLDGNPVCISWQPYRKSDETFTWISEEAFKSVREYVFSILDQSRDFQIDLVNDEIITDVVDKFEHIDYKKFEQKNILK